MLNEPATQARGVASSRAPNDPKCGWHEEYVYSVSYHDAEVLIDRQTIGEIEIRVWRNGKHENYPYAKMTFAVDTFVCGHCTRNDVESAECDECVFCVNCCTHHSDEDDEGLDGKVDLPQVYESLEAAIDVVCDEDTQNALSAEYRNKSISATKRIKQIIPGKNQNQRNQKEVTDEIQVYEYRRCDMGTRSLTLVLDEDGKEICVLYRQYDGYPAGHGFDLKQFLSGVQIVNGLGVNKQTKVANGMGCLAAQLITFFKAEAGGFYLYPAGARDCGEEYIYTVYLDTGKLMMRVEAGAVTLFGFPGTKQVNMPTLYDGEVESFDPDAVERLWRTGGRDQVVNDFVDDVVLSSDTLEVPEDPFPPALDHKTTGG
jgi:hypothetical protein